MERSRATAVSFWRMGAGAIGLGLLIVVAMFGALTVGASVPGLAHLLQTGQADRSTPPLSSTGIRLLASIALLGAAGLAMLTMSGWGPAASLPVPHERRRPLPYAAALLSGIVLATAAISACGVASMYLIDWTTPQSQQTTAGEQFQALDVGHLAITSIYAGVLEEISFIALPFTTLFAALAARDRSKPVSPRLVATAVLTVAVVCILIRGILHTYQGPIPAISALFWSAGNVAIYLRTRSVLALIIAHTLYDFIAAGLGQWLWLLLASLTGTVVVGGLWWLHDRRRDPTPPQPDLPPPHPSLSVR
jgi:membrane protease YdiL (CAAX protease family)